MNRFEHLASLNKAYKAARAPLDLRDKPTMDIEVLIGWLDVYELLTGRRPTQVRLSAEAECDLFEHVQGQFRYAQVLKEVWTGEAQGLRVAGVTVTQ